MKLIEPIQQILRKRGTISTTVNPRTHRLYKDDIFVASFPRSGNSWVFALIRNYLLASGSNKAGEQMYDIHKDYPIPAPAHGLRRYLKSHEFYDPRYPKVIYILRDVRDVAVSGYFFEFEKYPSLSFSEYLPHFYRWWGGWLHHVHSWLSKQNKKILLVKYEDLHSNLKHELKRILHFCNIEVNEVHMINAMNASSFHSLQKAYIKKINRSVSPNALHYRTGIIGGWRQYFDESSYSTFIQKYESTLKQYGYEVKDKPVFSPISTDYARPVSGNT